LKFSEFIKSLKIKISEFLSKEVKIKNTFSIKYKILIGIAGVVLLNIIINIIFINLFMNKYYISLKQGNLENTFANIKKVYSSDPQQISNQIYKAEQSGISIRILDENNNYLYRSANFSNTTIPISIQNIDKLLVQKLGQSSFLSLNIKDNSSETYLINYIGRIDNNKIILSSSIRVIEENTSIAQTFIIISSTITFVIIAVIIYLLSNKVTKKIDDIREITENISNLNFN
jgi:hypothetical protein